MQRILSTQGYDVFVASDGLEGVNLAQKTAPDLILMDINLPQLDGRALTTRLRQLPHLNNVPIIALTADITDGSREMALAAGCSGFLNKPVNVDLFPAQIESFLHGETQQLDRATHAEHLQRHTDNVAMQLEKKVRELHQVNALLVRLDRMKSDFIVLASHELHTPLTLVSGYTSLLAEQLAQDEASFSLAESRQLAHLLSAGVERMQQVVHEIMNVARIASGRLELATGPVQVAQLVADVVADFAPVFAERHVAVQVTDLSKLPLVYGDGGHLKTAVSNVLENAVKFTPNGGRITISGRHHVDWVELQIRDTGIGIPVDELESIFEQFYTLGQLDHHSSSKTAFEGGGMGLGLTIAAGVVEAHNGRIWAESSGQDRKKLPGSSFFIRLPVLPAAA